jgi:hypothetical protein
MAKENCWEILKCGREPDGAKAAELGVCPASTEARTEGINGGNKGGRACWALVGTLCGGKVQGSHAAKGKGCMECDFYHIVKKEEGVNYESSRHILVKLQS